MYEIIIINRKWFSLNTSQIVLKRQKNDTHENYIDSDSGKCISVRLLAKINENNHILFGKWEEISTSSWIWTVFQLILRMILEHRGQSVLKSIDHPILRFSILYRYTSVFFQHLQNVRYWLAVLSIKFLTAFESIEYFMKSPHSLMLRLNKISWQMLLYICCLHGSE